MQGQSDTKCMNTKKTVYKIVRKITPSPLSRRKLTGDTQEDWERETTCWRDKGEGGGRGAESIDCKKALFSINQSTHYALTTGG